MASFNHANYTLVNNDRIVKNAGTPPLKMTEEGEILQEIGRYVEARLIHSYGFISIPIPGEDANPSTTILATQDWQTAAKLLLIIQNSSGSMMGIFSRSLCLEQGLNKGSMIPYVERALAVGYGILILRPNANSVMEEVPGEKSRKVLIPGSETPEVHTLCVWENIVSKNENATHIALLGYGNGAILCKELLLRQVVRTKEDESEANRIKAFVTIEASDIIDDDDGADIKNFINAIAVNMECNPAPRGYRLTYRRNRLGCTSISLGLPLGMSEVVNVASSASLALDPVFKYLDLVLSGSNHIILKFCQIMAEDNGHSFATSELKCTENTEDKENIEQPKEIAEEPPSSQTPEGLKTPVDPAKAQSGFLSRMFGSNAAGSPVVKQGSPTSVADADARVNVDEKLSAKDFDLLNIVGKGAFGKVMLVRKKSGVGAGKYFAMKILKKSFVEAKGQIENTKSEREILCEIRHPYIVRLRFAFQNDEKLYLVTDYYNGGTLFYHLRKSRAFSEERARFYAAELLLALNHLHSQSIIYRDLKLENVLLDHQGHVALTDFGLSKQDSDKAGGASTFCGTFEYIAPELFNRSKYGRAVDWWSFGVLLFEMMCGRTPFYDKNRRVMQYRIQNTEPIFPASFSKSACECIRGLLQVNEFNRLGNGENGANDIMTCAFFSVIDFNALFRREITPPFTPDVSGVLDTKYVPKAYLEAEARDSVSITQSAKRGAKTDDFVAFTFAGDSGVLK